MRSVIWCRNETLNKKHVFNEETYVRKLRPKKSWGSNLNATPTGQMSRVVGVRERPPSCIRSLTL